MKWGNQSDTSDQKIEFGEKTERGLLCSVKVEEICRVFSLVLQWETFPQKNWWKRRNGWMRKKTKKNWKGGFSLTLLLFLLSGLSFTLSQTSSSLKPPPWPKLRRQDPQHRRSTTIDALIHNITHTSNSNRTKKTHHNPYIHLSRTQPPQTHKQRFTYTKIHNTLTAQGSQIPPQKHQKIQRNPPLLKSKPIIRETHKQKTTTTNSKKKKKPPHRKYQI